MAGYWWEVVQRAFAATFEASGIGIWGPISVAVGALVYGLQNGWSAVPSNLWETARTGGLTLIGVFALVFAFKLISVPPQLRAEERATAATAQEALSAKVMSLKHELTREAEKQAALNDLWALRKQGVELRNRQITQADFPKWHQEYVVWESTVLQKAEIISVNLRQWIAILNETRDAPRGSPFVSEDHALDVRVMSEQLRRLEDYLTIGLK